jgi:hypothetical protein
MINSNGVALEKDRIVSTLELSTFYNRWYWSTFMNL